MNVIEIVKVKRKLKDKILAKIHKLKFKINKFKIKFK